MIVMAERVGFEPTVGCPTLDFESSALNRAQPTLLAYSLGGSKPSKALPSVKPLLGFREIEPILSPLPPMASLHPDLLNWFKKRSWKPFPFQLDSWKTNLSGQSGLLHAPTGFGKTSRSGLDQSRKPSPPEKHPVIAKSSGSLSREEQNVVVSGLKSGSLRCVVCTSLLDLGVDYAPVDQVIQGSSSKGIARLAHEPGVQDKISLTTLPCTSVRR